ncbi:hypothetical protein ACHAXT_007891 [Thalassiosira profunda]
MARTPLALALAVAALASGGSAKQLIGDVISERLRGSSQARQPRRLDGNDDILQAMMKKEVFDHARDECLLDVVNGTATYGRCDIRQFPFCSGDTPHICFNRINRRDAFWPDKHPKYYIDYNRIHCYPDKLHGVDFTCSSCSPGRWCVPEGRCILDENKYHCWADETN